MKEAYNKKEWIDKFVEQAIKMELEEIYIVEHLHRFEEFSPMYASICSYSEYQNAWYNRKKEFSNSMSYIEEAIQVVFPSHIDWQAGQNACIMLFKPLCVCCYLFRKMQEILYALRKGEIGICLLRRKFI